MISRIVITGIGLTSPVGNSLEEYRDSLLSNRSGITHTELRYIGKVAAGLCSFDELKWQNKKARRRGTRAGAIGIYCANEAIQSAGLDLTKIDKSRIGIYVGTTEHGSVETENEIHQLHSINNDDVSLWSHHHNPRTVSNNPAGEISLNLGVTGPAYVLGAACAAGNIGPIHAMQMLQLGEIDIAIAGGVSESTESFGIFASFQSQGALGKHDNPQKAGRPLDINRNGIVVAEGGALFVMERLEDAIKRGAKIYGEVIGHHINSDATDFVLPNPERQIECMEKALKKANLSPESIDIVNMHATGTPSGDIIECEAVSKVFGQSHNTFINCTKGYIGHTMGAAGSLELAGNIPSFFDSTIHPSYKIESLDPKCALMNLLNGTPLKKEVHTILNNSFGMLGINSTLIIKKYQE